MRVAIIAPPFIPVPPKGYGGTELFVAALATGLTRLGHAVVVYANGESRLPCEVRALYPGSEWPLADPGTGTLKSLVHTSWAFGDLGTEADIVHVNDTLATVFAPLVPVPVVKTLHHPHEPALSEVYSHYPGITYVAISEFQARQHAMPRLCTIHHGLPVEDYRFEARKDDYLLFLGRIAPLKGTHVAIAVARSAGLPLKIAGARQPIFRDYWDRDVAPHLDGHAVEYLGEADFAAKNDLLSHARALLFPIDWDEPFGLVLIEAMACGTPVLAFPRGSVSEIVEEGVNGHVCADAGEMARRAVDLAIDPATCRDSAMARFHVDVMVRRYEALFSAVVDEDRMRSGRGGSPGPR